MNTWHVGDSPYALPTQGVRLDPRTVSLAVGVLCAAFAGAFAVGRLTPHGHGASSGDYAPRTPSLSATSVSAGVTARLGVVPPIGNLPVVRRVIPHASRPTPSAAVQSTPSISTPALPGQSTSSIPTPAAPERAAVPSRPAPPPSSPSPAVSPAPAPTGGAAPPRESSGGGSSGRQTGGGSSGRHGGGGGSFDSSG